GPILVKLGVVSFKTTSSAAVGTLPSAQLPPVNQSLETAPVQISSACADLATSTTIRASPVSTVVERRVARRWRGSRACSVLLLWSRIYSLAIVWIAVHARDRLRRSIVCNPADKSASKCKLHCTQAARLGLKGTGCGPNGTD